MCQGLNHFSDFSIVQISHQQHKLKGNDIQFLYKKMYPYGCKLKILWSALEYLMPQNFQVERVNR